MNAEFSNAQNIVSATAQEWRIPEQARHQLSHAENIHQALQLDTIVHQPAVFDTGSFKDELLQKWLETEADRLPEADDRGPEPGTFDHLYHQRYEEKHWTKSDWDKFNAETDVTPDYTLFPFEEFDRNTFGDMHTLASPFAAHDERFQFFLEHPDTAMFEHPFGQELFGQQAPLEQYDFNDMPQPDLGMYAQLHAPAVKKTRTKYGENVKASVRDFEWNNQHMQWNPRETIRQYNSYWPNPQDHIPVDTGAAWVRTARNARNAQLQEQKGT